MDNYTSVRMHKETKKIIDKYCAIHFWTVPRFFDTIALLLRYGLDLISDDSISIDQLRQLYGFSSLQVIADTRTMLKPTKEGLKK